MNVALIELTSSHEECLYSQVKFITDAGYRLTLIINPKLRSQISTYEDLLDKVEIEYYSFDSSNSFFNNAKQFAKLYNFLVRENFQKVIFNTASSRKEIILLSLLLPRKDIKCYGTIHNLKKLNHSVSQKIISLNIKKYFVINDFLLNSIKPMDKTITLESYYPIFFPDYGIKKLNTKDNNLWICIPGELDFERRDYHLLINIAQNINDSRLKFIILGKANKSKQPVSNFLLTLKKLGLEANFLIFDTFIANQKFHSYIANSDYIMAPNNTKTENYLTYKITGAYNLAFAYQKPLLCDSKFKVISDLNENSFFYEDQKQLEKLILDFLKNKPFKKNLYRDPKWSYEFQKEKYLKFINN